MIRQAIGLIETIGLAAAIEAADIAVKSANVKLLGYELTKGQGKILVKIEGDVGAVKAAIEAAQMGASKVNEVYGKLVIARPSQEIEKMIYSKDNIYNEKKTTGPDNEEKVDVAEENPEDDICNLCFDPLCTRKKGEPRTDCIHNNENNESENHENE